jgi:hypothetical protein|tara:strand:- start:630 stop:1001 length:372 start_codon:yes stop_codon:yes gene_type:complete
MAIEISITEATTSVVASGLATTLQVYNTSLPLIQNEASGITSEAYGPVTATTVQGAIEQLADQNFRQDAAPTGATVSEGDTWYDTDDDEFKVYREISTGVFAWAPIMIGTPPGDSDIVDAGAF